MKIPKWIPYATAGSCLASILTILAAGVASQKMMASTLASPEQWLILPFFLGGFLGAAISMIRETRD